MVERFVAVSLKRALAARISRVLGRAPRRDRHQGPLVDRLRGLTSELRAGAITPEEYVRAVEKLYRMTDLEAELGRWLDEPRGKLQSIGFRQFFLAAIGQDRPRAALWLFFVPPGVTYPPHAHHDMASAQCVVRGNLRVRQYERVSRLDPLTIGIRPVSERGLVPGGTILMTEFLDNVHWFGTEEEPAILLNCHLSGGFRRLFDRDPGRSPRRYWVDPTGPRGPDGLIAAPEIPMNEARARFATRPLTEFPPL